MHASDRVKESDWYSLLSLGPAASTEEISAAVERMSRQAAALANTSPHRSQELREITRAIKRDLLSGTENRQRYDQSLLDRGAPPAPAAPPPAPSGPTPPAPTPSAPAPPPQARQAGYPANPALAGLGARLKKFMQTSWTCPACGEGAMPSDKFCKTCGTAITPPAVSRAAQFCGSCGKPLASQEIFCSRCGTHRGPQPPERPA
jgi:hypothetical protein